MVVTHNEAQEKGDGEPPDGGEWDTRAQSQLDDETLEERWDDVRTFISSIVPGEEDLPDDDIPSIPGFDPNEPDSIDLDIDTASQLQLLGNIAQSNLVMLQLMSEVSTSVDPSKRLAVSTSTFTDEPREAKRVLSKSPTTDKVLIKASEDNTSPVYIGGEQVTVGDSFELRKGQTLEWELDLSTADIHFTSEKADQEVQTLGFR